MSYFSLIPITDKEFKLISSLVYDTVGIHLTNQKRHLVVSRLQKLLNSEGFNTFEAYYDYIVADKSGKGLIDLVDFISTTHTFFNREKVHFEYVSQKALPEIVARLKKQNSRDLRIWCAAASTGEEPYMLAMLMHEFFGNEYEMWNSGVLATDISRRAMKSAKAGLYTENQIKLLPVQFKHKYFKYNSHGLWSVSKQLKRCITFRFFNLMNKNFPFKKPFHIIFCRNVMIYFDEPTRKALVRKLYQFTEPGGYLFIGHSESLGRGKSPYKYVMPAVYKKIGN